MTKDFVKNDDYRRFIAELKSRVQSAQIKAAVKVNEELIGLYWEIGKQLVERQRASKWGDNVIAQIATDLTRELGGIKGFSRRNLFRMKQWYTFYASQGEKVPQLVAQIPWGHNSLIIEKIKDVPQALWYVQKTLEYGWARSVLQLQIESGLYERQAEKPKIDNFSARLPAPQSDLFRESLKDPYCFDFLNIGDEAHEREIESAGHLLSFR